MAISFNVERKYIVAAEGKPVKHYLVFSQCSFTLIIPLEPLTIVQFRQGKCYYPCFANKEIERLRNILETYHTTRNWQVMTRDCKYKSLRTIRELHDLFSILEISDVDQVYTEPTLHTF